MAPISYARHRFPPDVIHHAVWLYLRFTLSYRDVDELLAERGRDVSGETIRRWILKAPMRFDQDQSCLLIAKSAMKKPKLGADPVEWERILEQIRMATAEIFSSTAAQLRHLLRTQLISVQPSLMDVAKTLTLNPRTICRCLVADGVTFEAILDDVRYGMACEMLDGHYAHPEAMDWCEDNGVTYLFGLTGSRSLSAKVEATADAVRPRRALEDADAALDRARSALVNSMIPA